MSTMERVARNEMTKDEYFKADDYIDRELNAQTFDLYQRTEPYIFAQEYTKYKNRITRSLSEGGKTFYDTIEGLPKYVQARMFDELRVDGYHNDFFRNLGISKIINVNQEVSTFLETNEPTLEVNNIFNPYPAFFLNKKISHKNITCNGVMVINLKTFYGMTDYEFSDLKKFEDAQGVATHERAINKNKNMIIYYFFDEIKKEKFFHITALSDALMNTMKFEHSYDNLLTEGASKTTVNDVQALTKEVIRQVVNFIKLYEMKSDSIHITERVVSNEHNQKREKRGKPRKSNTTLVGLRGDMKEYYSWLGHTMRTMEGVWLVRGFERTYRSDRYKNMKGKKQKILPFLKGADGKDVVIPEHLKQYVKVKY